MKWKMIGIMLLIYSALVYGNEFYKPAEYRYYLHAMDQFYSLTGARPLTVFLMKGEKAPVIPDFKQIFPKKELNPNGKCQIVIRRGITGECIEAEEFPFNQTITLPYLKPDFYHITFHYSSPDGKDTAIRETTFDVIEENKPTQSRKTKLSPEVFYANYKNDALVFNGIKPGDRIHLSGERILRKNYIQRIHEVKKDIKVPLPELKPGMFLRIFSQLERNGKMIAQTINYVGKSGVYPSQKPEYSNIQKPLPLPKLLVHENESFTGLFEDNKKGLDGLFTGMKERGANVLAAGFPWYHYHPLTNSFDFEEMDRYIDYITKNKIHFDLVIGSALFDKAPFDSKGEWMMNNLGDCLLLRETRSTSPASPKYKAAIRSLIRELHNRYGKNPYWRGWVYIGQGLDGGTFRDTWKFVTDYSPAFRDEFRSFLQKRYPTIQALNKKWNTQFPSFNAVTPPLPDYSKEVEDSPEWYDFTDAKMEVLKEINTNLYDREIRKYDKKRAISNYLMYMGPIEYLFPLMKTYRSSIQDGGGEADYMVRLYSICENNAIRRHAESVYVPADKLLMQQDLVSNTLRYGMHNSDLGTVWNGYVNMHSKEFIGKDIWNGGVKIGWKTYPERANLQTTMKFWKEIIDILRTMENTYPAPPPIGIVLSWDDMLYRTRCWRWFGLLGGNIQNAAAALSLGNVPWVTGITPFDVWKKNRLLLCSDENYVFSMEMIRKMERFVKEGGILAIAGDSGKYTVNSKESYLWKQYFNAPEDLNKREYTEWNLGKGRIIYCRLRKKQPIHPIHLRKILELSAVSRNAHSSNPKIEAFLLKDNHADYLIISAYRGLNRVRNLKKVESHDTVVTLPSVANGQWKVSRLYPGQETVETRSAKDLREKGFSVKLSDTEFQIYKLKHNE